MNFSFVSVIILVSAFGAAVGQGNSPVCNICGPDSMMGNENGVVVIPGLGSQSCAVLQGLGDDGVLSEEQCTELQPIAREPCDCTIFICPICGNNGVSNNPNGIVDIPGDGQGQTTCAAVNEVAKAGGINETVCPQVQAIVKDPCGCQTPSLRPSAAPSLSSTPSRSPPGSPSDGPTVSLSPTVSPTADTDAGANVVVSMSMAVGLLFSLVVLL